MGVGDVGAAGHHPAHELRGEYVAKVDVHFLPHVSVVAVCRGLWVLRHVRQGGSVGRHRKVGTVGRVGRQRRAGRVRPVRGVSRRRWVVQVMCRGRVKSRVGGVVLGVAVLCPGRGVPG